VLSRLGTEKPITFFTVSVRGQGYNACQASSIPVSSFTLSLPLSKTSPTVGGVLLLGLSLVPHSSSIGEKPSTGTLHPVVGRLVVLYWPKLLSLEICLF
jgi:hypothetical protein